MEKEKLLGLMKGQLIVSCQALPGEAFYDETISLMDRFAIAAQRAGAAMIRANGLRDIQAVKKATGLPVIGLIKKEYPGYDAYITPTENEIEALLSVHADVIALDCTHRQRGDGRNTIEFMTEIRRKYPDAIFMADIAVYEEGIAAWKAGMDLISTTMSGYTEQSRLAEKPDYQLVERLSQVLTVPVIAEGRIEEPDQAARMLRKGAYAVVVGGAITRPQQIAGRFVKTVKEADRMLLKERKVMNDRDRSEKIADSEKQRGVDKHAE